MNVKKFAEILGADFFTGVPDSQLKALCDYLNDTYGTDKNHHIICANEGNAVAVSAGYHLATGKTPVVYMQNSGEGNIINPLASLLNEKVYAIPEIFVIGWRGQPDVHDEPQHIFQGEITLEILKLMGVEYFVISPDTPETEVFETMENFRKILSHGKCVAFVIKKGGLTYENKVKYRNGYSLIREEIIEHITKISGENPIVSTTGKASRELFEIRERNSQGHGLDFLTVGSMGHTSSIALGVALHKPGTKIWCVDGDGSAIMHMGSMAVVGSCSPENLVHIVINNEAHETVGGMPTSAKNANLTEIARSCGYGYAVCVDNFEQLDSELEKIRDKKTLCFLEIKCGIGSRADLGRPTTTAIENKNNFMKYLSEI